MSSMVDLGSLENTSHRLDLGVITSNISKLASIEQEIHALVKVRSSNLSWIISAIYLSPRFAEHCCLWNNLSVVANLHNLPWVMLRDFNEVLSSNEKFRQTSVYIRTAQRFKYCLDECGMMDLGFMGPASYGPICETSVS